MAISRDEVKYIADLARLGLSEQEIDKYTGELSQILDYINVLNEVNTDDVEPTAQVTGLSNIHYSDQVENNFNRDELLAPTPLEIDRNQIKVHKPIE